MAHVRAFKPQIDLTVRPLLPKILKFIVPLMLTGILQLLYNAADIIVVGRFVGKEAMAAVGSTGSLVNLMTNLFLGLSVGSLASASHWIGAGNEAKVDSVTHTSITISVIAGIVLAIAGFFLSEKLLMLMGTPPEVLPMSTLYLKIFFLGMPFSLLYNFGSSLLRAVGDTKNPLIFLMISGVINVVLNIVLVVYANMSVAGVAVATIVSQAISAILVVIALMKRRGYCKLKLSRLRINKRALIEIAKIGLPAGIQSTIFSLSNVIIQSSINGAGAIAMAGNAAAANVEGFVYTSMNAVSQASLTFVSHNIGAGKVKHCKSVFIQTIFLSIIIGLGMGLAVYGLGNFILGIYNPDPEVIKFGLQRLAVIATTYFLCGVMEVLVGVLRGIGHSMLPMIISIFGVCGIRLVWIYTVFAATKNLNLLYWSYPISWLITIIMHTVVYIIVSKKVYRKVDPHYKENEPPQFNDAALSNVA